MKPRATIALLLLFLAVCFAYWWVLRSEETAIREAQEAKRVFPERTGQDVQRVRIAREGEDPVVGERTADGWRIVEPHELEGGPQVWARLSGAIAQLSNERTISEADSGELDIYGLTAPRITATITWADGAETVLRYGVMEPTARYRYAMDEAGTVFLTNNETYNELNRSLLDLRNRYLVGTGRETVTRIAYTRIQEASGGGGQGESAQPELAGGRVQATAAYELREDGRWMQVSPIEAVAHPGKVDEMVRMIQFAAGRDYSDEPGALSDYGLSPAGARITVHFEGDRPDQTVFFGYTTGPEDKGIYVKRADQDTVFVVDASVISAFPETPDAFRDRRLVTRPFGGLERLEYHTGQAQLLFVNRPEEGWRIAQPDNMATDQIALNELIRMLADTEGEQFPGGSLEDYGLSAPALRMRLHFEDEEEAREIRITRPDEAESAYSYAMQDTGEVITLPATMAEGLIKEPFYFEEKRLMAIKPEAVHEVTMRFEGNAYAFEKNGEQWEVVRPEGKAWESQSDMMLILEALAAAEATALERRSIPGDLHPYGLDQPLLEIEADFEAEDGMQTAGPLRVGDLTGNPDQTRYAVVEGREGVYHTGQVLIDDLRAALAGLVGSAE